MAGTAPTTDALWPPPVLRDIDYANLRSRLHNSLSACLRQCRINPDRLDSLCRVALPLAAWAANNKKLGTLVIGISGAQGAGKSTLSALLNVALSEGYGYHVAGFSLDDLYRTHAERVRLAADIHPLLKTRGVPGTHDIDLGLSVIDALVAAGPETRIRIPSFDKALDDRRPEPDWPVFTGHADIVIIEGWCLGARPQSESALMTPINELEASEDGDGTWRRYVNGQLAGEYSRLFARLQKLIMLKVPGMSSVHRWRRIQEEKLTAATGPAGTNRIMDKAELRRFVMHYERLTRAMLEETPQQADLVLRLNEHQQFTHIGVQ